MLKKTELPASEKVNAKIFEKKLGLTDNQISSLQHEFSSLMQENEKLKNENKHLRVTLKQAKQEIVKFEKILDTNTGSSTPPDFDDISKQILKKLFETNDEITAEDLAEFLNVPADLMEHRIDELMNKNLIDYGSLMLGEPATYLLSKEGRKYVTEGIVI